MRNTFLALLPCYSLECCCCLKTSSSRSMSSCGAREFHKNIISHFAWRRIYAAAQWWQLSNHLPIFFPLTNIWRMQNECASHDGVVKVLFQPAASYNLISVCFAWDDIVPTIPVFCFLLPRAGNEAYGVSGKTFPPGFFSTTSHLGIDRLFEPSKIHSITGNIQHHCSMTFFTQTIRPHRFLPSLAIAH